MKDYRNVLALDLGTKTGFCYGPSIEGAKEVGPGCLEVGTWALATKEEVTTWRKSRRDRTRDPRVLRLYQLLRTQPFSKADLLIFEDVQFSSFTKQDQLWSSFRTVAWLSYPEPVTYECVPVGTLKKFATGHGNATKEMMKSSLLSPHCPYLKNKTNLATFDDNAIDAIWLWLWAFQNLSRTTA